MNSTLKRSLAILILFLFLFNFLTFDGIHFLFDQKAVAAQPAVDVKINFQPEGVDVPEGYIPDSGDVFGYKNGYSYGWNISHKDSVIKRNVNPEVLVDTVCMIKPDGIWEIEVPNGDYDVTISVGDAVYGSDPGYNSINIENVSFFSNLSLQPNEFKKVTKEVTVKDGRLSLDQECTVNSKTPINYIHISSAIKTNPNDSYAIKLEMYNGNTSETNTTLFPRFRLSNIGTTPIDLSTAKIVYYFTNEGGKKLKFWCDWASIGNGKIVDSFIESGVGEKADTSLEIGFKNAGVLAPEQNIEIHARVADIDWSNMNQLNDYSFNPSDSNYAVWEKATVYINGVKVWGTAPEEVKPEPSNTPGPSPTTTPFPQNGKVKLQMYNASRKEFEKNIDPSFKLTNTSNQPLDMKNVKIRYYYMVGGDTPQNFWCDWSSIGTGNVKGNFVKMPVAMVGADYYVELTFDSNTGFLEKEQSTEIKTRFARAEWTEYNQTDDYSFNAVNKDYTDWTKATVYVGDELVWGEEPSQVMPITTAAKVQVYNTHRNGKSNTIYTNYTLINTGNVQFNLSDVKIRYYYTKEGMQPENFWCDWSSIGSSKITNNFVALPIAITNQKVGNYLEIGFADQTGNLIAGDSLEIHTRMAKTDWSEYIQDNDYSFNAAANKYVDWDKVGIYIKGKLVWGKGVITETPANITAQATEESISLSWNHVDGAICYEVEDDGVINNVGFNTHFSKQDLQPGTEHKYRIRAISDVNTGDWTVLIVKWTLPDIPQNITATSSSSSIRVAWEPVQGAVSYEVEVSGMPVDVGADTSYIHEGLNHNTQRAYRVRAKNSSGVGKWSEVISKTTLPGTSSGISTSATSQSVTLMWDRISGATAYDLEVDEEVIKDIVECSFVHSQLIPATEHSYRVRPKNQDGVSNWSDIVKAFTLPETPTGLNAVVKGDSITLSWNAANGAQSYEIEVDGAIKDNGDKTSFVFEGLSNNSEHTFRVRAKYQEIKSFWSKTVTTSTLPGVPENLKATAAGNKIGLTWDMVEGALSYDVEINESVIQSVYRNQYTHEEVTPNTEYTFRVRAVSSAGSSEWSAPIKKAALIGVPQNVTAIAAHDSITIEWQAVTGAAGYEVLADGEIRDVTTDTYYAHRGLQPNTLHVYRVRAKSGNAAGEWTVPLIKTTIQGVPGNVRARVASTNIILVWDPVSGATSYEVKVDGAIFEVKDGNVYVHDGLRPNSEHTYSVRSKKDGVVSPWSNEIKVRTAPGIPKNLRATVTTNEIHVSWDTVEGAGNYEMEVDGQLMGFVDTPEYIHEGLEPNTRHTYRVRAKSASGESEWSEKLEKNTAPVLAINAGKDNMFNFVFVVPKKWDGNTRTITVKYNVDELEVIDLCAVTPALETTMGKVEGTNITVQKFTPGEIVYRIEDVQKTVVNSIKFVSKINGHSRVVYTIE